MTKPPRMNFMRAGSRLETLGTNRIPHHEREEAYSARFTGSLGRTYYLRGLPIFTV